MTERRAQHQRGVAEGIGRFWRDYEIRNTRPTLEDRTEELERKVDEIIASVNAIVRWVDARDAS